MQISSMLVTRMKWAGGTSGSVPSAGPTRAIVRIAISALWLTAGIGEAAVAADGVTSIGQFTGRHSKYASCGYTVMLWRAAETIVGEFYDCEGDDGTYGKAGLIRHLSYDKKTGHLTFIARLSSGNVYAQGVADGTPARDLFTFDGRLATTEITGTLIHVDEVVPQDSPTSEQITLKKEEGVKSYPSLADWRRDLEDLARSRGYSTGYSD
jgi:hypothetical protein